MLNTRFVGLESDEDVFEVDRSAIRRFAEAIGDPNPLYHDESYARAHGYASLVAPPTFPTTFRPSNDLRASLGIDLKKVLHGEQEYVLRRPIVAGERIRCKARISEIYEKAGKSGAMDFVVTETVGRDESSKEVFRARSVTVVRR